MTSVYTKIVKRGYSWIGYLLFAFAMSLLNAAPAQAEDCVKDLGGVLDGFVTPVAPSQIQIDGNCTIRNFPASNPLSTNFSFLTQPGQTRQRWLLIFDNVVHTGQMSCNSVQGHKLWLTNSSWTGIHQNCQNLMIPVEKINKQNPAGQTTATIGVPFTYKLTIPVLFDPATGTVINNNGSPNDLHGITVQDDLNATGADLSYVSHVAYWLSDNTPVPHAFYNVGGLLTFDNIPIVRAGQQFVIEITVVLNNTPANVPGRQFINTAKWDFGRLIDGTFYEPLPGEWGVTPPMTIVAPVLAVTKSGPSTMNLAQWGDFVIDVQNTGLGDAWNAAIRDRLPDGATGGMCDRTPEIQSARVFAADGVTPVPGKGLLNPGSDYLLSYSAAPGCQLDITMLTAAGRIGPNERLILRYRTQLDAGTQNGITLTNVAGAIQWFNGDSSNLNRLSYNRTLTDGTPSIVDHEDPHTVTTALTAAPAFLVQKISTDLTGDPNVLLAGETLRYTITVKNTGNEDAVNVVLRDAVPANTTYVAGSTTLNGAAIADVGGLSPLANGMPIHSPADPTPGSMPADASPSTANVATITFDVVVSPTVPNATVISNQGFVSAVGQGITDQPSDDPNTPTANDPTRDSVGNLPSLYAEKRVVLSVDLGSPGIVDPGDTLRYTITVRNSAAIPATGVVLTDAVPANTTYVANSTQLNGSPVGQPDGGVAPLASGIQINSSGASAGTVASGATASLQFDLRVNAGTPTGTLISNQALVGSAELPNLPTDGDGNPATGPEPTVVVVGVGQQLSISKQVTVVGGGAAVPGATLEYVVNVTNIASVPSTSVLITDDLNASQLAYVSGSATMNGSTTGVSVSGSTITANYSAVSGSLGPGASVVLRFQAILSPGLATGTVVTNIGVANWNTPTQTANASVSIIVGSVPGSMPSLYAEKRVVLAVDLGSPGIVDPGDTLRYTITLQNSGAVAATGVVMTDTVPANTTYLANSTRLNGSPVGQPDGGVAPLASGIQINSSGASAGSVSPGATATLQFELRVNAGTPAGTLISNQALVRSAELPNLPTDGDGNPATGPEPTVIAVGVGQQLAIAKQVTVVGGGAAVPGATLEYVVSATNIASVPSTSVVITDDLNASQLAYVSGSATMNGSTAGVSVAGSTITANYSAVSGSLGPGTGVVLRFQAILSPGQATGTVVTNTGVATWNTPTQTASASVSIIVGGVPSNMPSLYSEKRVALAVDLGSPGIVDPGDTLHYTITVRNSGAVAATGVAMTDAVPANTTYLANSTRLNGSPVGQPDGGVAPLASGIQINSSGASVGTVSPGATATLQFDLRVNAGTPTGTLISNQAVVRSAELPNVLTDGDGNPATGPEPTVIAVGVGQQLSITKQVSVVGGGPALPGATLEYVVNATNIASVPSSNVVITDDLDASQPGQLTYVSGSATMNGSTAGVSFSGSTIAANYAGVSGSLGPGTGVVLRFRALLNPGLAINTVVTNTGVVAWNTPTQTASANVTIVVGSLPGVSVLSGSFWHDADFDDTRDPGERPLVGWTADLYRNSQVWNSVLTDANGVYRFIGVEPNDATGVAYELRFRGPGAGANTAMLGRAVSPFTNGMQRITDIVVSSGANLQGLNLPIHPNGVIYNSLARLPIAGATLSLLDAGSSSLLPASCFDDAAQQGQVTLADGYYKFDINFSDPACPSGGDYFIQLTAGANYFAGSSQIIPATSSASTPAFSVPACPNSANDAISSTAMFCEVQPSELAPAVSVAPRSAGTIYHVHLRLDGSQLPGTGQIFNNHIPLDPQLAGSLAIFKTTPMLNVSRGQLVPYTITVNNVAGMLLSDVSIVDRLPLGFTYISSSALLDGVPSEPTVAGQALQWNGLVIAGAETRTVKLLLAVGAGVTEGEYVNRALVMNTTTGGAMSGEATATVRVMPDPSFDCTDVTGKAFNDANRNGIQDEGEAGLPGVRVVTERGLAATTDQYGRFHITCAITPNENRGSNFVLKLDDRTLPSGFRLSTDQLQIKRATRGKDLKFNFGASIYRVVGIDLSDAVFEPNTTEVRVQWRPRMDLLLEELRKGPAVLRLSYVADTEDAALVERRVEKIRRQLTEAWNAAKSYVLTIEPEVFWRRGAPPKRLEVRPKNR